MGEPAAQEHLGQEHEGQQGQQSARQRLARRWMPARVFPKPVLEADRPWEGRQLVLYGTILPMPEGGYRLYYSSFTPAEGNAKLLLATTRKYGR